MREGAFATLVLAAGGSRRLGQPKQLVRHNGQTLVRRAAGVALDAGLGPVWVVVGAEAEGVEKELAGFDVVIARNADWAEGLASSIRVGLQQARRGAPDGLLLMLCDQLSVSREHLGALAERWRASGRAIVASRYGEALGVPALFGAEVFDELGTLAGDTGAKRIIERDPSRVVSVLLKGGDADVDTPQDLRRLEQR